ncbi:MAG: aspartate-semialdehyde dehydrogenase [Candidatus Wallacebacter cryptica]
MRAVNIAILGATGAVGQELLQILAERKFPIKSLKLLASPRSAGRKVAFNDQEYVIEAVSEEQFEGVDIAFFAAGGGVSKQWVSAARAAGCIVIDNSSAFRMDPDVPLIVPEVNVDAAKNHQGIIANPNCSTIIFAAVLKPIYDAVGIERVVVSTYQAVSGAGQAAIDELTNQAHAFASGSEIEAQVLPVQGLAKHYPILFNVIPQIDIPDEQGYTKEEWKMIRETQKIFGNQDLRITATTVRVPTMRSHCESINVETKAKLTASECRELIKKASGLKLVDDLAAQEYPMPIDTSGQDLIWVGRIREDTSLENGLNLWVVGDQIRKGAALNAIQIAENLIRDLR